MTTDITELAQRVERIISDMKLKHGVKDTYAPVMKWDEFLALVEELEKAQSAKRTLESLGYTDNGGELWRPPIGPKPNFSLMDSYRHRIAELESRTVKLPLPRRKTADDYVDDTFEPCDLAAVYNACRLVCEVKFKNALIAAGIKWEAE